MKKYPHNLSPISPGKPHRQNHRASVGVRRCPSVSVGCEAPHTFLDRRRSNASTPTQEQARSVNSYAPSWSCHALRALLRSDRPLARVRTDRVCYRVDRQRFDKCDERSEITDHEILNVVDWFASPQAQRTGL